MSVEPRHSVNGSLYEGGKPEHEKGGMGSTWLFGISRKRINLAKFQDNVLSSPHSLKTTLLWSARPVEISLLCYVTINNYNSNKHLRKITQAPGDFFLLSTTKVNSRYGDQRLQPGYSKTNKQYKYSCPLIDTFSEARASQKYLTFDIKVHEPCHPRPVVSCLQHAK